MAWLNKTLMRLRIFALVASAGGLPTHPCGRDRVDSYTLLAYYVSYTLMAYKSPYGVHRSTGLYAASVGLPEPLGGVDRGDHGGYADGEERHFRRVDGRRGCNEEPSRGQAYTAQLQGSCGTAPQ